MVRLVDIKNVCFHYDKDAPVKSKKLRKQRTQAQNCRFDVYTTQRLYHFNVEEGQDI